MPTPYAGGPLSCCRRAHRELGGWLIDVESRPTVRGWVTFGSYAPGRVATRTSGRVNSAVFWFFVLHTCNCLLAFVNNQFQVQKEVPSRKKRRVGTPCRRTRLDTQKPFAKVFQKIMQGVARPMHRRPGGPTLFLPHFSESQNRFLS